MVFLVWVNLPDGTKITQIDVCSWLQRKFVFAFYRFLTRQETWSFQYEYFFKGMFVRIFFSRFQTLPNRSMFLASAAFLPCSPWIPKDQAFVSC